MPVTDFSEQNKFYFMNKSLAYGENLYEGLFICHNTIETVIFMLLKVLFYSIFSAAALFLLVKFMGEKQISQMNMFDYITGITIGSIAAEMATNIDFNPLRGFTAMAVYALIAVTISYVTQKNLRLRKILAGRPIVLMRNGQLLKESFKQAKIDLNEFLMLARIAGYFNISEVNYAIMEGNGTVSFLPQESDRPVKPSDMQMNPKQSQVASPVIIDGEINTHALKAISKSESWLNNALSLKGYKSKNDIFLAVCTQDGDLSIFGYN